jgi:hypothetical protein
VEVGRLQDEAVGRGRIYEISWSGRLAENTGMRRSLITLYVSLGKGGLKRRIRDVGYPSYILGVWIFVTYGCKTAGSKKN